MTTIVYANLPAGKAALGPNGVTASVYVEDITTAIASFTTIRLYRDTAPTGAFTSLATSATLVAATRSYTLTDSSGVAGGWYRYLLYTATGPNQTQLSEPFQAQSTLRFIRTEALRQSGVGFDSTCSADGTTTTLIDASLIDTGIEADFLEGAWVYRPDAVATGDKVRRVKKDGYASSTGTLSFDRAYTNLPASGEAYQIYNFFPPIDQPGVAWSWDRSIRKGLDEAWFIDRVNLGLGTSTRQTRFSLAAWPDITERTIRRVYLEMTDTNSITTQQDANRSGRYTNVIANAGSITLEAFPAPTTTQALWVEAVRRDSALYADTDVTNCPLPYAIAGAVLRVYERLRMLQPKAYDGEYEVALDEWRRAQSTYRPEDYVGGI